MRSIVSNLFQFDYQKCESDSQKVYDTVQFPKKREMRWYSYSHFVS